MNVIHTLKLCIIASFTATMFVGIMFIIRSSDEEQIRSHARSIVVDNRMRNLREPERKTEAFHSEGIELVKTDIRVPSVHVFYYPWYGDPELDNGRYYHWNHPMLQQSPNSKQIKGSHLPPDDIASIQYPLLGPYSSRNTSVIEKHMKWISSAGIDVVVVSWYPSGKADDQGYPWDSLMPTLLDAAQKHKLKITFHLEPYSDRTAYSVRDDIKYILNQYGNHSAFYRTARKEGGLLMPLFYVYDSYKVPKLEWQDVLSSDGSSTIRASDFDSLIIGLALVVEDVKVLKESGFDGVYTYFATDGFTEASTISKWPSISNLCNQLGILFIPSVGPGYDDTRVRPWNSINCRSREAGAYYKRHFKMAHTAKADIVSITSFNEWHEGTQIEPAIKFKDENGTGFIYVEYEKGSDMYLQLTNEMVREYFVPHHENIPMQIAKIV